jgi:hypothetical protein
MAEKSSLRGEAKMPPRQASGKRRQFDPLQINFVCYLNHLIPGGARWIRTRDISNLLPRTQSETPVRCLLRLEQPPNCPPTAGSVAYPVPLARSRIDARWAAGRVAGCPLGSQFAQCPGERSVLGCRALKTKIRVRQRPRGSRLRPRARSPCRRPMRAFDTPPSQRRSSPSARLLAQ